MRQQVAGMLEALEGAAERRAAATLLDCVERRIAAARERTGAPPPLRCPRPARRPARHVRARRGRGHRPLALALALMPELGSLRRGSPPPCRAGAPRPPERRVGYWRSPAAGARQSAAPSATTALSAASHNPQIRAFYRALVARGKPPKLALTAAMRKLLARLNTLGRDTMRQLAPGSPDTAIVPPPVPPPPPPSPPNRLPPPPRQRARPRAD
ncbi:MAG: hypothetical protein R3F11_12735 [Verrucomicrobiales bacterium]